MTTWPVPFAFPVLGDDVVTVWSVEPVEATPPQMQLLCESERQRARRFRFNRDRNLFVSARCCLRQLLGKYLGVSPRDVRFDFGPQGKPTLAGEAAESRIQFNLSHTEGMALVALTVGRVLGVDIERVDRKVNVEEIGQRFFSPREFAALAALPVEHKQSAFLKCWTRKEAFIKAQGGGLSIPLDQFHVSLDDPPCLLGIDWAEEKATEWKLENLSPAPEFVAALAVKGEEYRLQCFQWEASD